MKIMDRDMLENVFVTALEGGSNYWYILNEPALKKVREAVPRKEDPYFATAMLKAVLDHGVEVEVHDAENPDELLGKLSYSLMEHRLKDLAMDKEYMWALQAELEGDGDATSSDVVFQYLVIGSVWFS